MGYFGLEVITIPNLGRIQMVTGFFLCPKYRTKKFKQMFIDTIKETFPQGRFMTSVFSKNERAIRFFKEFGGEIINTNKAIVEGVGEAEYNLISV
jgi:RimJ/RimL family protein N-acetyltransferase